MPEPAGRPHRARPLSTMAILLSALALAAAFRACVLDLVFVRGRSMDPVAAHGSLAVVAPSAYGLPSPSGTGYLVRWSEPRPGQLVILRAASGPGARNRGTVIKRVLETGPAYLRVEDGALRGRGGSVRLDSSQRLKFHGEVWVPGGTVFVSGDNAAESWDSRDYGPVPIENVRAKVLLLLGN